MTGNGQYQGEFEHLINLVEELDTRSKQHGDVLGMMSGHLSAIAENTGAVARHFQEDNRALAGLAAGKNQVSVHVLLVLMVLCGAYVLAEKVSRGDIDVKIPFIGLEISHGEKPAE